MQMSHLSEAFLSSPFFSASMTSCVENGGDAYVDFAASYNNSSTNVIGIATAADSLYAIRRLVTTKGVSSRST